jgi:hypothetical protein
MAFTILVFNCKIISIIRLYKCGLKLNRSKIGQNKINGWFVQNKRYKYLVVDV